MSNGLLNGQGEAIKPPKSPEDEFLENTMPEAIKDFMAVCAKHDLNGWKYLAVTVRMLALGIAQQPRGTRPQIFKALEQEVKHFIKKFHVAPSIIQPGEEA